MVRKKANRRSGSRGGAAARCVRQAKAIAATAAIIFLSSVGLWRCLGGGETERAPAPVSRGEAETVDVGDGVIVDPTLVNEGILLEQEEEAVEETAAPEPEPSEASSPPETAEPEAAPDPALEERFPLYGVAFHFHTQLRADADFGSRVIGYARRGATFRLSEKQGDKGCARGWFEVAPGSMFVCNGAGVIIDDEPVTFAPSAPQPRLDQHLPYAYAYAARDNTPEYWRIPTPEEAAATEALFERIAAVEVKTLVEDGNNEPKGETDSPAPASDTAAPSADAVSALPSTFDGGVPDPPLELPPFVHLRMAKGYYVSLDDVVADSGREYQRTVRGRFIPKGKLYPSNPSDFEGFLVTDSNPLPRAYVVGGGVSLLRQETAGGALVSHERVDRYLMMDYLGEMTRRNRRYVQVGEGLYLSSRVTAVAREVSLPEDIGRDERWIHIDLSEQTLVAYEGARPVFATLVSTGKKGFETPTGSFRIYVKHVTVTMDDTEAGAEAYSIEDVPWVQYFKDGFGLHAAFWHDRFGRVRSHGCVNLSPADAMRLFKWTGPTVPEGVHGIFATKGNPGTRVVIEP